MRSLESKGCLLSLILKQRFDTSVIMVLTSVVVEQISGKVWHNRGFNDKSVKTSKIVRLDLLNKIGYGPIA